MESNHNNILDKIFIKIGINILLLQQIEKGLKIIIPYIYHNASAKGIDGFRKYQEGIKSQTLGYLVNSFITSIKIEASNDAVEYFTEGLKNIVANRNKLVHGLDEFKSLKLLDTEEGCKKYISYLDSQHQEAVSFYKDIQLYVCALFYFLKTNYSESKPEWDLLYEQIKASLPSEVEYINEDDPSDTIWKNTRIVKLLRLAELNTVKINNMTSLSLAGQFIKNNSPECTPKKYGIKTLKSVLKVSGLFEIVEYQKDEKGNLLVLYKSKV